MEELIRLLEKLKSRGIINEYAIGGATALVYYFEPINTVDIDVFVALAGPERPLVNLAPLYSFISDAGYSAKREYVLIGNVPVQFLVPYNELLIEAVNHPKKVSYGRVKTNLVRLEYLMAIMLQTGRLKDRARLADIVENRIKYDRKKLEKILKKFFLWKKWLDLKAGDNA